MTAIAIDSKRLTDLVNVRNERLDMIARANVRLDNLFELYSLSGDRDERAAIQADASRTRALIAECEDEIAVLNTELRALTIE